MDVAVQKRKNTGGACIVATSWNGCEKQGRTLTLTPSSAKNRRLNGFTDNRTVMFARKTRLSILWCGWGAKGTCRVGRTLKRARGRTFIRALSRGIFLPTLSVHGVPVLECRWVRNLGGDEVDNCCVLAAPAVSVRQPGVCAQCSSGRYVSAYRMPVLGQCKRHAVCGCLRLVLKSNIIARIS